MLDILGGGLLGSIFGGLFRLATEVLKFMDRKNERLHELKMFEQQCQLESMRGADLRRSPMTGSLKLLQGKC
jgi:hypothetical protein